jgi:hypothetical protein
MFNGQNISGTTQAVVAGQQIALSVTVPQPYAIQSRTWTIPNLATATVSGYTPGTMPTPPTAPNQDALTFYWVIPGDNGETVTYTYSLNNGQSASATATFNVGGPTGDLTVQATMAPLNTGVAVGLYAVPGQQPAPEMILANSPVPGGSVGISFAANAATPVGDAGSFQWVQLVEGDQTNLVNSLGARSCPVTPEAGLDTSYPYAAVTATTTYDSPSVNLVSFYGEMQRSFTATMYLMWDPALPTGCSPASTTAKLVSAPSNCGSIPVPLSSVQWHFSGCSINTLANQANKTTWFLNCGINNVGQFPSSGTGLQGFPTWGTTVTAGLGNCGPVN